MPKYHYRNDGYSLQISRDQVCWFCFEIDKIPPYLIADLRNGSQEWESSGRRPGTGKNFLNALESAIDYAQEHEDLFHEEQAN